MDTVSAEADEAFRGETVSTLDAAVATGRASEEITAFLYIACL